jgi:L-cysteine:1D-myo-inositol 2-amino-2-deoxy-alpha-D-glucopyranoside ligase
MSKSRGNLVLVSRLRESGADPMAIRVALLGHHYRDDWEWTDADLDRAGRRLARLRAAVARGAGAPAAGLVDDVLGALASDLDAPRALSLLEEWAETDGDDAQAGDVVRALADAALGVAL